MKKYWVIYAIWVVGFVLTAYPLAAQPPDSVWSRTYGGSNAERCYFCLQTSDGGYLFAGETWSFSAGLADFWLVKTAANGSLLWQRAYGGFSWEYCYGAVQTSDGGYVLAGCTQSFGAGNYDFWLVKTDADGDTLWTRAYGGPSGDWCYSVQQSPDGGYLLAGYTQSFGAGGRDFWLLKTDADGDSLWSRTFGGTGWEACFSIHQAPDGGYILTGCTNSLGAGREDFWLLKTNDNGDSLWSRTFGGSQVDVGLSVCPTFDGGYILAGCTQSFGLGQDDLWLVKTDENGDSLWSRTFGGSGWDGCNSVIQTSDSAYVLAGHTTSFGAGGDDFWLVRTDAQGDSLWTRTFGGSADEQCYSVQQTSDGGCVLAGFTNSFGAGGSDFWVIKLESDLLAEPLRNSLPCRYTLYQNWPNPFNSIAVIAYDLPRSGHISLEVFDLMGREVRTLVNEVQVAGTHHVAFDGTPLASGIYFYCLRTGDFAATKKMVFLK